MINFYIKTYGCQANVADSQAIANFLSEFGAFQVDDLVDASLIIINTCAIREKAEQKVYSYIGRLKKLKDNNPYLKVVVIGCIASYRKKDFYSRFPFVQFVFGARDDKKELKQILSDFVLSYESVKTVFDDANKNDNFISSKFNFKKYDLKLGGLTNNPNSFKQSFVNIMTGCNNFCSYCIVPFTRGREVCYSANQILEKIKLDISFGAKEIILLGQNVNSYRDPEKNINFALLLEKVAQIDGDFWVRFMSPHPKDMTLDVIEVMAKYSHKICSFIHHPLQSGSDKILALMNRSYSINKYLEQIDWVKKILPDATISTDVIVGFPAETEEDFKKTMQVVENVRFNNIFSFIYSPRKFTKAALMKDDCLFKIKQDRLDFLQKKQVGICKEKNEEYVGKILKCLVEKRSASGKLFARSAGNLGILFDGDDSYIDTFVDIKVDFAGAVNLVGSLV